MDDLLPRWHFRERHQVPTTVPPPALLAAAEQVTWAEVPLMRTLMRVRAFGRIRFDPTRRITDDMNGLGFTVLDRTPHELVVGAIGRPWTAGDRRSPSGNGFTSFAEPGWAKMALNFRAADGVLSTETRVWLTDAAARRRFAGYWLVIRPFSGLIRRAWLRAIVRRAGRPSAPGT